MKGVFSKLYPKIHNAIDITIKTSIKIFIIGEGVNYMKKSCAFRENQKQTMKNTVQKVIYLLRFYGFLYPLLIDKR